MTLPENYRKHLCGSPGINQLVDWLEKNRPKLLGLFDEGETPFKFVCDVADEVGARRPDLAKDKTVGEYLNKTLLPKLVEYEKT